MAPALLAAACSGSEGSESARAGAAEPASVAPEPASVAPEPAAVALGPVPGDRIPDPGAPPPAGPLGEGFVVWESDRGGAWRIWTVDLAPGSTPRQLTPDEPGRVHCCPHLSPDGTRLAFLSLPPGGEAYKPGRTTGPLRLLDLAAGEVRELAPAARTYFENRAVVWRGDRELVFIDGDGRTRLLDLDDGTTRPLTEQAEPADGWLIDPRLAFATRGRPSFSPYDPGARVVRERAARGGCQPYFTSDGVWGYWVAGAGGPVNRIDLTTGESATILAKGDARTVDGYGYAYFPMFSADRRAFAWAASRGDHSHVAADYEIFVAPSDPDTLELVGAARRITHHAATDRFPDVHLRPQALGSHRGEAPFHLELAAPGGGGWRWSFGDGATARGGVGRHEYAQAGRYRVEAERDGERLTGSVVVRPAAPPEIVSHELASGGRELRLIFDEEIDAGAAVTTFASARPVESRTVGEDGRTLVLRLAEPLSRVDRLEVAGVRDRAQRPNVMAPATLEILPPSWPARRDAIFVWRTADAPNLFFDPAAGVDRAGLLEPAGRAFLDREHRMVLRGGTFTASEEESNRLRWALQTTNEMALELTVEPFAESSPEGGVVVFGRPGEPHNFALLQRGNELVYSQRVAPRGPEALVETRLGPLAPGRRHLVLSYAPGRLTLDVDGERVVVSDELQGDFFHWRSLRLAIGGRAGGGLAWSGAVEGLAIYDRVSSPSQARESFERYRTLIARRSEAPVTVVEARLRRRSPTPSLAEIRPYREALAVHEYEVERVLEGASPGGPLLVAHWELLDGERQPAAERRDGDLVTLRLEPFEAQKQLAGVFLANRFDRPPAFFAVDGL